MENSYTQDDTVVVAPFIPQSDWIRLADPETIQKEVRAHRQEEKLALAEAMEYDNALRSTSPALQELRRVLS